ncbi:hypothetical protein HPP92_028812 [Vanilla planifolia]|uniref:Uncharacterized protein n=1 Tax=Vanilla planifolia TaxID=51239 RepID=A0A835U3I7_VANPL|nr:hypothetical protein HPP92_028812 [Vanilla planifolia]KAG0446484.1 hypothetical protein HPP92_028801 [Vanilla planifolia]
MTGRLPVHVRKQACPATSLRHDLRQTVYRLLLFNGIPPSWVAMIGGCGIVKGSCYGYLQVWVDPGPESGGRAKENLRKRAGEITRPRGRRIYATALEAGNTNKEETSGRRLCDHGLRWFPEHLHGNHRVPAVAKRLRVQVRFEVSCGCVAVPGGPRRQDGRRAATPRQTHSESCAVNSPRRSASWAMEEAGPASSSERVLPGRREEEQGHRPSSAYEERRTR